MTLRGVIIRLLAAVSLTVAHGAIAQPQDSIPRVGFLSIGGTNTRGVNAFRAGLRDLGRIEGKNIALEIRGAKGRFEHLPVLAAELVRWNPDVLVTVAPQGYHALRSATKTIPVVIIACDPAEAIVKHIARPSGNVTGVTCMASDITPKRLQLLKEVAPHIRRVAVLYDPFDPNKADEVRQMHAPARSLGVILLPIEAREAAALEVVLTAAVRERADALFVLNGPVMFMARKRIAELAAKHALPAMYAFKEYVEAGGLISYGTMQQDLFRRAAAPVDKILKGSKPVDIPVEQATLFELVINLKTAKALGLTIPQMILLQANRVIE